MSQWVALLYALLPNVGAGIVVDPVLMVIRVGLSKVSSDVTAVREIGKVRRPYRLGRIVPVPDPHLPPLNVLGEDGPVVDLIQMGNTGIANIDNGDTTTLACDQPISQLVSEVVCYPVQLLVVAVVVQVVAISVVLDGRDQGLRPFATALVKPLCL